MLSGRNGQWQTVQKIFHNKGLPTFSVQVICYVSLWKHPLSSDKIYSTFYSQHLYEKYPKRKRDAGERLVRHRVQKAQETRSRDVHVTVRRPLGIPHHTLLCSWEPAHHKFVPTPSLLSLTKSNRQQHLHFKEIGWASLVAQWWRIRVLM